MKAPVIYHSSIDKNFSKMLAVSISFHVFVVSIFAVRVLFFPTETIDYQAAVRVDMVALPEKRTEVAPAPKPSLPKPEEAVAIKAEPAPTLKNVKDLTTVDLKKKQTTAIEQMKALQELEEEMRKAKQNEKRQQIVKGNMLASGSTLKGLNKLDYDTYIGDVDNRIKANWELPEWLAKADLRARARVLIDERGYVIKKDLILSSKNPTYDSLVLDAIDRSSPFPPPPEKLVQLLAVEGIVFQFPD